MDDTYEITQAIKQFLIERRYLLNEARISVNCGAVESYLSHVRTGFIKNIKPDKLSSIVSDLKLIGFVYNKENIPVESFGSCTPEKTLDVLTIDKIFNATLKYFNVPRVMAESKTRKREIVQVRQIAMKLSKDNTRSSLAMIGMEIGDKDHSTAIHACKTIQNLIETDKKFREQYEEIEYKLGIKS